MATTTVGAFGASIVIGVLLDTVQEHRAEAAAETLRASVALRERVLRDGRECDVAASEIVAGDIVLLAAGDLVPADVAERDEVVDFELMNRLRAKRSPITLSSSTSPRE